MQYVLEVRRFVDVEKLNSLLEKGWKVVNISVPRTDGM